MRSRPVRVRPALFPRRLDRRDTFSMATGPAVAGTPHAAVDYDNDGWLDLWCIGDGDGTTVRFDDAPDDGQAEAETAVCT